jgi:UDP-N-acetylmuramate dehydrogenase
MNIQENVTLAPFTTFHIGGPAEQFIEARSQDELAQAVIYAQKKTLPYFILGTGANILVGDKGIRGLVIKNEANKFSVDDSLLTADSGAVMSDLIGFTAKKGLSGFEHFAGIPSTIGGALWQNLHFLSPDRSKTLFLGDILASAEILTEKGEKKTVDKDYFQFSYDSSILHTKKDVVLSATFQLTPLDEAELEHRIDENLKWREEKHPQNAAHCSAGSVFKKIESHGAGRLIEQVGLKGHQIGGAQISERHANFIVNTRDATAKDVLDLINLVKEKVKQELGLEMQLEISLIGEF